MKKVGFNDSKSKTNKLNNETRENFGSTDFNELDGVSEEITPKKPEHHNVNKDHPYMGNLTSHEIGMMLKSGALDGEMFKRMTSNVQQDIEDGPTLP